MYIQQNHMNWEKQKNKTKKPLHTVVQSSILHATSVHTQNSQKFIVV